MTRIPSGDVQLPHKINILASYAYQRGASKIVETLLALLSDSRFSGNVNVLIDSGGFTDYHQGIKYAGLGKYYDRITVDEYIGFCHKIKDKVWGYIQLDKPRNPGVSEEYLDQQVAAGLRPIPILVQGMPWSKLHKLLEINERICISAGWYSALEYSFQRYQRAYKYTGGRIKSHALAWGRYPDILGLPISSADSSTWLNGGRYGQVLRFDKLDGFKRSSRKDLSNGSLHADRFMAELTRCGVTKEDIRDSKQWRGHSTYPCLTIATHAYAFLCAIAYIRKSKGIEYFTVQAGLESSPFFHYIAVVASIQESGYMDYRVYKEFLRKIEEVRENSDRYLEIVAEATNMYKNIENRL